VIRIRGTVTYESGELVEWKAGSAIFVAWEAYCRRQGIAAYDGNNPNTMAAYCAYAALGIREGFDVWLASVEDVATDEDEAIVPVPPTPAGASVE
jgi:hypothetical protein